MRVGILTVSTSRAAQHGPDDRVRPAPAAAGDAGPVERPGDGPQPLAPPVLLPNQGDGPLLAAVLDEAARVVRIGAPPVGAAVGPGHAPALGLVP